MGQGETAVHAEGGRALRGLLCLIAALPATDKGSWAQTDLSYGWHRSMRITIIVSPFSLLPSLCHLCNPTERHCDRKRHGGGRGRPREYQVLNLILSPCARPWLHLQSGVLRAVATLWVRGVQKSKTGSSLFCTWVWDWWCFRDNTIVVHREHFALASNTGLDWTLCWQQCWQLH